MAATLPPLKKPAAAIRWNGKPPPRPFHYFAVYHGNSVTDLIGSGFDSVGDTDVAVCAFIEFEFSRNARWYYWWKRDKYHWTNGVDDIFIRIQHPR